MDVQVSNARRIGFTALALVAFLILAHRSYWISSDYAYWMLPGKFFTSLFIDQTPILAPGVAGLMVFAPTLLLLLSVSNHMQLGCRWVWISAMFFFATFLIALWLGRVDAEACLDTYYGETLLLPGEHGRSESFRQRFRAGLSSVPQRHVVSWLLLLTPIILTTAFVIVGAWRRAVRDADVVAEVEDG